MKKVDLKVCMGTMCYVLGGAQIKETVENLPAAMKEKLNISFSPCLEFCNENDKERPPFIELNGKKISEVSTSSLLELLKKELGYVI